jgi:predicted nucleic acid-binding protein
MTLVLDASVVVAALVDDGEVGRWAEAALDRQALAAPHLMPFEAANILRRATLRGDISEDVARLAHADLLDLTVELVDYGSIAARAWELRASVTVYDAAYVALAEALDAPMMTLDLRLARASGPGCAFLTPSDPVP